MIAAAKPARAYRKPTQRCVVVDLADADWAWLDRMAAIAKQPRRALVSSLLRHLVEDDRAEEMRSPGARRKRGAAA